MDLLLFPFAEYWWFYASFMAFVVAMLALDLGVFHKESHEVSFKEAGTWTAVWIGLALIFNYLLYLYSLNNFANDPKILAAGLDSAAVAKQVGLEFLTGFVVEKSLAIDNIFVFVMVFSYFNIPAKYQHRVLFYGIIGALAFRALFIAMGSYLMQFHWVIYLFGGFLILTGVKMMFAPESKIEPDNNPVVKLLRKLMPITGKHHGEKFFIKENAKWVATPLFVALVFLEVSDIIFAIDSVPAIFALTKEPMIVFTSNIFAILGLRSMYFMLAGVVDKFYYLKYGLALVLVFVGLKMVWLNDAFGGKFPIGLSLGIIGGIIGTSVLASFVFPKQKLDVKHSKLHNSK